MFRRLMQLAGLALAPFAALLASRVFGMLAAAPIALAYFLRQQRRQRLTYHAQQVFTSFLGEQDRKVFRRMTSLGRRLKKHFGTGWGLVTVPSGVVLFQLLSALLLTPIGLKMAWDAKRWSDFLSDLWQVHASVIAITFVVIVFLMETAGKRLGREHLFRLSVRETNIQPIAYAGLTLTATIGFARLVIAHFDLEPWWAGGLGLSCASTFGLFLVVTALLYKDTLRFLQPYWILQVRLRNAAEAVARAVRSVIAIRLGNALLAQVCDKLELPLSSFARSRQDLAPIQATRHGRVSDIRLDKLERFAQMLEREVQVAGQRAIRCEAFWWLTSTQASDQIVTYWQECTAMAPPARL